MFNRKLIIVLVVVIVLPLLVLVLRFGVGGWNVQSLTISPQTTVIETPIGSSGYPDYIAALNQQMSEGVTPQDNAAVLLLRAMGPREIPASIQGEFFTMIGMPPWSETNSFVDWAEYCKAISADEQAQLSNGTAEDAFQFLVDMQDEAGERPWSRDEFPHLAKWLDANADSLETIVAASRLPRYFAPLISEQDPPTLASTLLPLAQQSRTAAQALVVRAMLRLHEKEYQAAWNDLIACRRLGRLVGQGATLVDGLVGHAIEGIGVAGQMQFVSEANLTADEWAALQADADTLPPRAGLAEKFDRGERFGMLDLMLAVAQQGPKALSGVTPGDLDNPLMHMAFHGIDWNIPLATANEWMDRFVAAAKIDDPKQRAQELEKIEADIQALAVGIKEPWSVVGAIASRRRASEKVGDLFVALFCPAIGAVFQAESRIRTNEDLLRIGLALARYKADRGEYPETLGELVPTFLKAMPSDSFARTPFVYKMRPDGYLLYSVGANQVDDGGKSYDEDKDDLVMQVPRPAPKKAPANGAEGEVPSEAPADQ